MLPLITVVDIAHTTPQGVSSGETLQGVSHYDGAKVSALRAARMLQIFAMIPPWFT